MERTKHLYSARPKRANERALDNMTPFPLVVMPTISMFYGILIRMFFYDTDKHNLPHIHAEFQAQVAVYSIVDGAVLAGELPPNKHILVISWIEIHQDDLLAD
jgi:hypothetical protein